MKDFFEKLNSILDALKAQPLTPEERAVMRLLYTAWNRKTGKITQRDIARSELWLGCNKHEVGIVKNPSETTLRKVRQIIRDLRVKYNAPILSDVKGYWIPISFDQVTAYLARIEIEVKAQTASWFETYRCMQKTFDIQSKYFEKQLNLFEE